MSALEFKIALPVVKGGGIKIDDILVTPFVFRMTVSAIGCQLLVQPAMKAFPLLYIFGDIGMVMAVETAIRLIILVQGLVATLALLLKLGMTGNHLTRHEEQIQFSRNRRKTACKCL